MFSASSAASAVNAETRSKPLMSEKEHFVAIVTIRDETPSSSCARLRAIDTRERGADGQAGQNEVARGAVLAGLIAHNSELYGTGVVYLRLKGIVPPSTERQQQMRRPGH